MKGIESEIDDDGFDDSGDDDDYTVSMSASLKKDSFAAKKFDKFDN